MPNWKLEEGRPLWDPDSDLKEGTEEWLHEVFNTLPDTKEQPHRSVVELRVWGKYTYQEIADELGLRSRQSAHDLYARAIRWMRDGRIVEVGEGEGKFKIWFKGLGEEVDEWL